MDNVWGKISISNIYNLLQLCPAYVIVLVYFIQPRTHISKNPRRARHV